MKIEDAERRMDNCFKRIIFLATAAGANVRFIEAVETERAMSRSLIRGMDLIQREAGTVDVGI